MDLHKLGVRIPVANPERPDSLLQLIPVYHRWIQTQALDDLLIDVADYSHVHQGPGVLLVAHEGDYAFGDEGGERALTYYQKRALPGTLETHLLRVARKALNACRLLEADGTLGGVKFRVENLEIFVNDRLAAPNNQQTFESLSPVTGGLLERMYGRDGFAVTRELDPRARFTLRAAANQTLAIDAALERLAA